jgi:hypothetical protein
MCLGASVVSDVSRTVDDPDTKDGASGTKAVLRPAAIGGPIRSRQQARRRRVVTRHRGYTHAVVTFLADAGADLIRRFIAEPAHAQTAPR